MGKKSDFLSTVSQIAAGKFHTGGFVGDRASDGATPVFLESLPCKLITTGVDPADKPDLYDEREIKTATIGYEYSVKDLDLDDPDVIATMEKVREDIERHRLLHFEALAFGYRPEHPVHRGHNPISPIRIEQPRLTDQSQTARKDD